MTSTLGRARETADAIGAATGAPVEGDSRLIEIGQGEWEGRTTPSSRVDDADRYTAWRTAPGIRRPPGGEPIEAATQRVTEVLAEIEVDDRWPARRQPRRHPSNPRRRAAWLRWARSTGVRRRQRLDLNGGAVRWRVAPRAVERRASPAGARADASTSRRAGRWPSGLRVAAEDAADPATRREADERQAKPPERRVQPLSGGGDHPPARVGLPHLAVGDGSDRLAVLRKLVLEAIRYS